MSFEVQLAVFWLVVYLAIALRGPDPAWHPPFAAIADDQEPEPSGLERS